MVGISQNCLNPMKCHVHLCLSKCEVDSIGEQSQQASMAPEAKTVKFADSVVNVRRASLSGSTLFALLSLNFQYDMARTNSF